MSRTRKTFDVLVVLLMYFLIQVVSSADLYTGLEDLKILSNAENSVVENLEQLEEHMQMQLNAARVLFDSFQKKCPKSWDGASEGHLVENPIKAYQLIKAWRQVSQWLTADNSGKTSQADLNCHDFNKHCKTWAEKGECESSHAFMIKNCQMSCNYCKKLQMPKNPFKTAIHKMEQLTVQKLPDQDDYTGASAALLRLQRTYNISVYDLSSGNVDGYQSIKPLELEDCYHIGKTAVQSHDWDLALLWLHEANISNRNLSLKLLIAKEIAKAQIGMKDTIAANHTITKALGKVPDMKQERWVDKLDACESLAGSEQCDNVVVMKRCRFACNNAGFAQKIDFNGSHALINLYGLLLRKSKRLGWVSSSFTRRDGQYWKPAYEELCRQEGLIHYHDTVCRYRKALLPYYVFKEEILSMNPRVSLVYDVITDNEAERIQTLASSKLRRGRVGTERVTSSSRISKVTFLSDKDPFIGGLTRRIELITGLCLTRYTNVFQKSSDQLQVVNYGIGGHYEAHTDFIKNSSTSDNSATMIKIMRGSGDRIATFLLYISSVIKGGGTIFPEIKVHIPPIKNAAAFWFNAKLSGEYDLKTLHVGCPVLLGEKWVANKWIREFGNEFKRKCSTNKDDRYS